MKTSAIPSLPAGERVYAIGDIHGRDDLLERLVAMIAEDAAKNPVAVNRLVFLGDYVDRGPGSKAVIDYLMQRLPGGMERIFLRGNHEDVMLRFLDGDLSAGAGWLQYGGVATLGSYGVKVFGPDAVQELEELRVALAEKLPPEHKGFIEATTLAYVCGDYYFVHGGVKPGRGLDDQSPVDQMWIRGEFLSHRGDFGKVIVHGHSIKLEPDMQRNRIGIDTGAYATGHLTCLRLQGADRAFLAT